MRTPLLFACWLAGAPAALQAAPAPTVPAPVVDVAAAMPGVPVPPPAALALAQEASSGERPAGGAEFGSARPMTLPAVAVAPGVAQTLAPARPGQAPLRLIRAAAQEVAAPGSVAAQGERQAANADEPASGGATGSGAPAATPARPGPEADNTGRNKTHDRRLEAEDQSNTKADVAVVRQIRRALTEDDSLSMDAHNAKIIVSGSRITLRGPVASTAERQKVEDIVRKSAGSRQIANELEVSR